MNQKIRRNVSVVSTLHINNRRIYNILKIYFNKFLQIKKDKRKKVNDRRNLNLKYPKQIKILLKFISNQENKLKAHEI